MCQYKTLAVSNNGYAILCRQCNNIQLAYGTSLHTISLLEFHCLLQLIEDNIKMHKGYGFPNHKICKLPTSSNLTWIILSPSELPAILEIFEEAQHALMVEDTIIELGIYSN
ncbi:MAG: hypothetical protein IT237_13445 [Bacteroidia bacterium]|nr:hypothetical protein [Bacteroidia bacterium]